MIRIDCSDSLTWLQSLPNNYAQCCITSPPYWNLRDYHVEGQIGLEATPQEYIDRLLTIFHELKRVLRDDGTLWLNLGDGYAQSSMRHRGGAKEDNRHRIISTQSTVQGKLKPKDLIGMPWRLALALQDAGWWLRQDIVWHKPNPMPESARDRCTKAHEYLFLLTKSPKYYFDCEAIREPAEYGRRNKRDVWSIASQPYPGAHFATFPEKLVEPCILAGTSEKGCCKVCGTPLKRLIKKGSLIGKSRGGNYQGRENQVEASGQNHFKCSTGYEPGKQYENTTTGWLAQCKCHECYWSHYSNQPKPCMVIDPFAGAGTVAVVCNKLNRSFHGCDLSNNYCDMEKIDAK